MKAWMARQHGKQMISYSEPRWATLKKHGSFWSSETGWAPLPDELVNQIKIPDDSMLPIELTATPAGEARKEEASDAR